MSTATPVDTDLLLPDLRIKGFRGIKDLQISRLGRVTLLAGKNGIGKTTILEAVRVFSTRGRQAALFNLLWNREETVVGFDDEGEWGDPQPDWDALFYGWALGTDSLISIGPSISDRVSIRVKLASDQPNPASESRSPYDRVALIEVTFQEFKQEFPLLHIDPYLLRDPFSDSSTLPPVLRCESLGPGLATSSQLARFWDSVALTEEESRAGGGPQPHLLR